jgi:protein-disulfide isomerase
VSNSAPRHTKNEKRDHAREQARVMREQQKKKDRRRRFFIQGGIGVAIIAIIAIIAVVVVQNNANSVTAAATAAGPLNMKSDGILFHGSGGKATAVTTAAVKAKGKPVATDTAKLTKTANIVEYIDYQCPYCNEFLTTNLAQEDKWVAAGKATLEIHPISILDASSEGNRYSSRAANAAACVANYDPNAFLKVTKVLYANQPAEDTGGMSNSKLLSLLAQGGASSSKITGCVNGETYKTWVTEATTRVTGGTFIGVATTPAAFAGTPTVFVNGASYTGSLTDAATFAAFVDEQKPGTAGS